MNSQYRPVHKKRKPKPTVPSTTEISFPPEIDVEVTAHHPRILHKRASCRYGVLRRGGYVFTRKRTIKLHKAKKRKRVTG